MSIGADQENRARERYNRLLRAKFARDPIFDIARVESAFAEELDPPLHVGHQHGGHPFEA